MDIILQIGEHEFFLKIRHILFMLDKMFFNKNFEHGKIFFKHIRILN